MSYTKRTSPLLAALLVGAVLSAAFVACGGTSVRPHGASIAEHDLAAEEDEQAAEYYDEIARPYVGLDDVEYHRLWALSRTHQRHAAAHRQASEILRASDDPEACDGLPLEVTRTCPLAEYPVAGYVETDRGVSVVYAEADPTTLEQEIRCHVAHAAMFAEDHADAATCPLVGEHSNILVMAHEAGAELTITSDDPSEVDRLRGLYEPHDHEAPEMPMSAPEDR